MRWTKLTPVLATLLLAGAVTSARAERFVAIDMDLPELGTDRRIILADMRRVGTRLIEDKGGVLVFEGGPTGWDEVETTTFTFNGTKLEQVALVFKKQKDDLRTRSLFFVLRRALAQRHGSPWFDRVRDEAEEKGPASLALQEHATTWTAQGKRFQLAGAYGEERGVKLVLSRHVQTNELADVEESDSEQRHWAVNNSSGVALQARQAADHLLNDFGEQEVVIKGARQKGTPITVRLRNVKLPKNVEGLSAGVISSRFEKFVRGHWDVEGEEREADLELNIEIVPVVAGSRTTFVMRLDAVVARGKERGTTLYSATQQLEM
jgi:hypothetical protein